MPVSFLRYNLACLLRVDTPVSLFVGPIWSALAHGGAITDRVFPGTIIPCPYVEQDSEVRVLVAAALLLLDSILLASVSLFDPVAHLDPVIEATQSERDASSIFPVEAGLAQAPVVPPQEDSTEWEALSTVPILWGRADPPRHPDEGIDWSNTSERRTVHIQWDFAKGSVSPPPPVMAKDLFSDRGDGFSLMHLRRKGENAESRTICPDYVSSGRRTRERNSPVDGELQASSSIENEEHADDEHGSDDGISRSRGRGRLRASRGRLRESRKTPFSLSPPQRSEVAFPRQYDFD